MHLIKKMRFDLYDTTKKVQQYIDRGEMIMAPLTMLGMTALGCVALLIATPDKEELQLKAAPSEIISYYNTLKANQSFYNQINRELATIDSKCAITSMLKEERANQGTLLSKKYGTSCVNSDTYTKLSQHFNGIKVNTNITLNPNMYIKLNNKFYQLNNNKIKDQFSHNTLGTDDNRAEESKLLQKSTCGIIAYNETPAYDLIDKSGMYKGKYLLTQLKVDMKIGCVNDKGFQEFTFPTMTMFNYQM